MPFYEYECTNCKFYVEALQKISDPPMRNCPSCKKPTLKKLVSAPVFRLKGGGWYETDFKSDQEGKRNLAGAEEAAEAKPAEDNKDKDKDAKPAEAAAQDTDKKAEKKPAVATSKTGAKKKAPARSVSRPAKTHSKAKAKGAKRRAKRRR